MLYIMVNHCIGETGKEDRLCERSDDVAVYFRDVKTLFFETGNQFAETGFLPVTERPIVSGIIVTGRSTLAISRSLVASRRPWLAFQTHKHFYLDTVYILMPPLPIIKALYF